MQSPWHRQGFPTCQIHAIMFLCIGNSYLVISFLLTEPHSLRYSLGIWIFFFSGSLFCRPCVSHRGRRNTRSFLVQADFRMRNRAPINDQIRSFPLRFGWIPSSHSRSAQSRRAKKPLRTSINGTPVSSAIETTCNEYSSWRLLIFSMVPNQ